MNATRIILFSILFFFLTPPVISQMKMESDTVFILFQNKRNSKHAVGYAVYHRPDLPYPKDVSRNFFVKVFIHKRALIYTKHVFMFRANPNLENFFFMESRQEFLKREYLDQDWFEETPLKDIISYLDEKIIILVDPTYLKNGEYYLLRVMLNDGIVP